MKEESIRYKQWKVPDCPHKILIIRLQALGDVIITLPYINALRKQLTEGVKVDFLTRKETASVPLGLELFDKVFILKGGRNILVQKIWMLLLIPQLRREGYEVIIDLQRNTISQWIRRILRPKAWSEIERFSPTPAGDKFKNGINYALGVDINASFHFKFKDPFKKEDLFERFGIPFTEHYIVLNPAGAFTTRNWPLENYAEFATTWIDKFPSTTFMVLGIDKILDKAKWLEQQLEGSLINLVNKTDALEAFVILQHVSLVLSEDSGLMHMAWVSGIPTLALFGSSRSDWSAPQGEHSLCLDSSDLECGECLLKECIWGDVRCLTRYDPNLIFEKAESLLHEANKEKNSSNY